jgi:hypothetical protein
MLVFCEELKVPLWSQLWIVYNSTSSLTGIWLLEIGKFYFTMFYFLGVDKVLIIITNNLYNSTFYVKQFATQKNLSDGRAKFKISKISVLE